jgi:hypothetical protein
MSGPLTPPSSKTSPRPATRAQATRAAKRPEAPHPFKSFLPAALRSNGDASQSLPRNVPGAPRTRSAPDRAPLAPPPPREHAPRRLDKALDAEVLAPFSPPPSVLAAPAGPRHEPPAVGDAADRAATAALVDRLVRSMHVGRVGRDGHELRLRLDASAGLGDVEVRLRHESGALHAVVVSHGASGSGAERLRARLGEELAARGVAIESLDLA